jgi:membrane dipeptidase
MQKAQGLFQCFAINIPWGYAGRAATADSLYAHFLEVAEFYHAEIKAHRDVIRQACSFADVAKNVDAGKMSAMLTVEDGAMLGTDLSRLDALIDAGVRMLTLTWNHENAIGFPCSPLAEIHTRSLKPFGIELVCAVNRKPVILDVSHLSKGGFYDVAHYSQKPFVASHSCAGALFEHPRNLTDGQLRVIGDCGGVVGINTYPKFLSADRSADGYGLMILHMKHIVDKAGIEALSFGCDLDGFFPEKPYMDYSGYEHLVGRMETCFSSDAIEKICNGNILRVLKASIDDIDALYGR